MMIMNERTRCVHLAADKDRLVCGKPSPSSSSMLTSCCPTFICAQGASELVAQQGLRREFCWPVDGSAQAGCRATGKGLSAGIQAQASSLAPSDDKLSLVQVRGNQRVQRCSVARGPLIKKGAAV